MAAINVLLIITTSLRLSQALLEAATIKKSGYLSRKKVKETVYIYLRKSYRENKKVKHKYIYSFGSMPEALNKMYWLRENPECFPDELSDSGFDFLDVYEWILTVETGKTPTGREFKV